jgi:hypothetical protein
MEALALSSFPKVMLMKTTQALDDYVGVVFVSRQYVEAPDFERKPYVWRRFPKHFTIGHRKEEY